MWLRTAEQQYMVLWPGALLRSQPGGTWVMYGGIRPGPLALLLLLLLPPPLCAAGDEGAEPEARHEGGLETCLKGAVAKGEAIKAAAEGELGGGGPDDL